MDRPVISGEAQRTWIWGPVAISEVQEEPDANGVGGARIVQYFDKGRMDILDSGADTSGVDFVRSGNLIEELATGQISVNGDEVLQFEPSDTVIAGDPDNSDGLTYRGLAGLFDAPGFEVGSVITAQVAGDGSLSENAGLADYGVIAGEVVEESGHVIASVFWEFLNSSGVVWTGSEYETTTLFPDPLSHVGAPITEAYWQRLPVAGEQRDVLLQCFERRCLTFTPGNPDGWNVEPTNAGMHYYDWRYNQIDFDNPSDGSDDEAALPLGRFMTSEGLEYTMRLEVAASDYTRACGLMHRDGLPYDTGMLFVWDSDVQGAFWNCNTFVPLTLAWIDAEGTIIGFSDMDAQVAGESQDIKTYPPPGPYRYVIEANQGWFADHGIEVGDTAHLEEAIERGDTGSETLCLQLGLSCS